jgi:hypothetical protein
MKTLIRSSLCCLASLLIVQTALAQKRLRQPSAWGVPEIYSDMFLEQETGDVGGMEVVLLASYSGDWATVIIASGIAYDPVLVPVKLDYPYIEFTLPATPPYEDYGKFTGKITRAGMILWNRGERLGLLRRQHR